MKGRCFNSNSKEYANYGARGITVCKRWMVFVNFLKDMGPRPAGSQIDRINNNGNYTPSNCRWATRKQQARNRRSSRFVMVNGVVITIAKAADNFGCKAQSLGQAVRSRLKGAVRIPNVSFNPEKKRGKFEVV